MKTAVVTGGASGLGQGVCRHLAETGHRVAVLDLNGDAAQALATELTEAGHSALAFGVDVSDRTAVEVAYNAVRAELGPIDILVTSAAYIAFTPFAEIAPAQWQRMMDINLTGTFHCVQLALPDMVAAQWGRIVTIASYAGVGGSQAQGHYSATKGGVIAMTKTVAVEYAAQGITANSIAPFAVDTPGLRQFQNGGGLPEHAVLETMIPAGRLGTADDIAATVGFLCSDAASYMTAQVLSPNGGAAR